MRKLWRKLKKWWVKMWGLKVINKDGDGIVNEGMYIGAIGDTIEIKPKTSLRIYPRDSDYHHIFVPYGGVYSGGFFVFVESDGSLTVNNNSERLSFFIALVRGAKK